MKQAIRKYVQELAKLFSRSYLGLVIIWRTIKRLPNLIKEWAKSDYLVPTFMLLYFIGEAISAVLGRHISWVIFMVVCVWGATAEVMIMLTKHDLHAQRKVNKRNEEFWLMEKREIVEKAIQYKESRDQMRALLDSASTRVTNSERRYDELLQARTEEIIIEVNRRLSDDPPVQHVFPDVPAAPQAPPELRPTPPF